MRTKLKWILPFVLLLGYSSAQSSTLAGLKEGEKISLSLTGKPLSDDLREKLLSDTITPSQIADVLSKSPDFIQSFAQYYTKLLKIQSGITRVQLGGLFKNKYLGATEPRFFAQVGNPPVAWSRMNSVQMQERYDALDKNVPALDLKDCGKFPTLFWILSNTFPQNLQSAVTSGIIQPRTQTAPEYRILPGTKPMWQKFLDMYKATAASCDETLTADVQPWWDPAMKSNARWSGQNYRALPELVRRCGGKTLPKCDLENVPAFGSFSSEVSYDFGMEAGNLIGHTVAEDRPFDEVLTTEETIMTGTMGAFYNIYGADLWTAFPDKGIRDIDHKIFKSVDVNDRTHYRIKRNNLHAGILTTPAYQLVTNGNRAKANRAFEMFLCRKFEVPAGAKPDPSDINPDLTKRTYCSYCHKSLEPMAAFFNRWPSVGETGYSYDPDPKINDQGVFNGDFGLGAPAFGKAITKSENFAKCSVMRAFEYLNGRKMGLVEVNNKLPGYLETFRGSNNNLRDVIKLMVLEPEFLRPGVK